MLGLFAFRSIGQLGFLLTGNEVLLAAFPNFLEPLFLVTASILAAKDRSGATRLVPPHGLTLERVRYGPGGRR